MTRQTLPPDEVARLRELRSAGPKGLRALRARVAALRDAGWPLAAVGEPVGANRSTTRMWQLAAAEADIAASVATDPVPRPPRAYRSTRSMKTVRLLPDVPPEELDELHRLAESARQVRGHTPQTNESRRNAEEFTRRVKAYVDYGVPISRIARHLGVTHRAVAARLNRGGTS